MEILGLFFSVLMEAFLLLLAVSFQFFFSLLVFLQLRGIAGRFVFFDFLVGLLDVLIGLLEVFLVLLNALVVLLDHAIFCLAYG